MKSQSSFTASEKVLQFLQEYKAGYIMFCKPFKVHGTWSIGVGAIIDIRQSSKLLCKVCKELYVYDKDLFVGDIEALFSK